MNKRKNRSCKKGYSCGKSCISVKYQCRTDGLKGQAIKLADAYFDKAVRPEPKAPEPKLLDKIDTSTLTEDNMLAQGSFGRTWKIDDKIVKQYFEQDNKDFLESAKKGNELANNTLVKDGLMPKMLEFDGQYSVQEALEGYESGEDAKYALGTLKNFEPFVEKIAASFMKHKVVHNDLHMNNIMIKKDADNNVQDIKLIDADFMADASRFRNNAVLNRQDTDFRRLMEDIANFDS